MTVLDGIKIGVGILIANVAFNLLMIAISHILGMIGYGG